MDEPKRPFTYYFFDVINSCDVLVNPGAFVIRQYLDRDLYGKTRVEIDRTPETLEKIAVGLLEHGGVEVAHTYTRGENGKIKKIKTSINKMSPIDKRMASGLVQCVKLDPHLVELLDINPEPEIQKNIAREILKYAFKEIQPTNLAYSRENMLDLEENIIEDYEDCFDDNDEDEDDDWDDDDEDDDDWGGDDKNNGGGTAEKSPIEKEDLQMQNRINYLDDRFWKYAPKRRKKDN